MRSLISDHVAALIPHMPKPRLDLLTKETLMITLEQAVQKDEQYTLFRYEEWPAWATFTIMFFVLIAFDNAIMNRNPKSLTMGRAIVYTCFWVFCAFGFCSWVYWYYGQPQAVMWMSGYILEWVLSFDNLFVFHMIFKVYGTPDHLKHRPLYLGICGAVFFRLIFIFAGEYLMHAMYFTHFIFGAFLIYIGIKTVFIDDDEEDPSQQPFVLWLQNKVPFVSSYDDRGAFFVRMPMQGPGKMDAASAAEMANFYAKADHGEEAGKDGEMRATMLFLVVCCLEASDLLFAVDSVSAIVAQVNDLFLAYTSAVFAMLGLRAMFFVVDSLSRLFSLLKYGVGSVLVFIGVKLVMARFYHIPPGYVCVIMISAISLSMLASVAKESVDKKAAENIGIEYGSGGAA